MKRRHRVAAAAVAVAIAAAVAVPLLALGGDQARLSRAQYSSRVTSIFAVVGERFRAGTSGTSESLGLMKAALDRAAAQLDDLRPPRAAEPEHRRLVAATREYSRQVDLVRASVDFGDPVLVATHLKEATGSAGINRAIGALVAKGYRIPVQIRRLR